MSDRSQIHSKISAEEVLSMYPEASLTVRDRLNFSFLLANQILTIQKATLNLEFSAEEVREAVEGLMHMIPTAWKDKKFMIDVQNAQIELIVDIRPTFCGKPIDINVCKRRGLPTYIRNVSFDYYDLFQSCIDLLNRRGVLSRRIYKEIMTGVKTKSEQAADVAEAQENNPTEGSNEEFGDDEGEETR
jgi:hypothetical protein